MTLWDRKDSGNSFNDQLVTRVLLHRCTYRHGSRGGNVDTGGMIREQDAGASLRKSSSLERNRIG